MYYFDSHAHYDNSRFKGNGPDIVKELNANGMLEKAVISAITVESNYEARKMFDEAEFPYVYFAAGIHPRCASSIKDEKFDWDTFSGLFEDRRTVAVKTGLDFSGPQLTPTLIGNQKKILRHLLMIADLNKLPVVLHVRDSEEAIIDELQNSNPELNIEVHCFVYDKDIMEKMIQAGVKFFGIGGAVQDLIIRNSEMP